MRNCSWSWCAKMRIPYAPIADEKVSDKWSPPALNQLLLLLLKYSLLWCEWVKRESKSILALINTNVYQLLFLHLNEWTFVLTHLFRNLLLFYFLCNLSSAPNRFVVCWPKLKTKSNRGKKKQQQRPSLLSESGSHDRTNTCICFLISFWSVFEAFYFHSVHSAIDVTLLVDRYKCVFGEETGAYFAWEWISQNGLFVREKYIYKKKTFEKWTVIECKAQIAKQKHWTDEILPLCVVNALK